VIIKPVIKIDKEGRTDRIVNTLNKFRSRGLTVVADYLLVKSRKSRRTAITFSYGLEHLNGFIEQNYKGYNIQTILPILQQQQSNNNKEINIDVYKILNGS
jgi:hypothetical protein